MRTTKIEWTDQTWNPTTGCTKVSPGCQNCYAERMAKRLKGMGQEKYKNGFEVTCHEELLETQFKPGQKVFVDSMSDLFHEKVPNKSIRKVWDTMWRFPKTTFQVLTKRPDRMEKFVREWAYEKYSSGLPFEPGDQFYFDWFLQEEMCGWQCNHECTDSWIYNCAHPENEGEKCSHGCFPCSPGYCPIASEGVNKEDIPVEDRDKYEYVKDDDGSEWTGDDEELMTLHSRPRYAFAKNVWLGTTVESSDYIWRIDNLRRTLATVRFISFEPLLGPIPEIDLTGIGWVIIGGETGPGARPMSLGWAGRILDQCQEADVPFFFKGWGTYYCDKKSIEYWLLNGKEWKQFPEVK